MKRPNPDRASDWGRWITAAETSRRCAEWAFRLELAGLAECRRLERVGGCAEKYPPLGSPEHLRCLDAAHRRPKSPDPDLSPAEAARIDKAFHEAHLRSLACLRDKDATDTKALDACIVEIYEQSYPGDL